MVKIDQRYLMQINKSRLKHRPIYILEHSCELKVRENKEGLFVFVSLKNQVSMKRV